MRARFLAGLLCAAAAGARAASFGGNNPGTVGAQFLTVGADARAAGMGNAVGASADDASGMYWNPADLAGLHYRDATFTYSPSYQATSNAFLAYAQPISVPGGSGRERDLLPDQAGTVGVSVQYQNAGRLDEIDNTGAATGNSFNPHDLAVAVGWGAELLTGLDAGVAVKYVSSQIEASAATGAADFGARWRAPIPGTEMTYALSVAVRNLGGVLKYSNSSDPLPTALAVGSALHPLRSVTVDLDVTQPRDGPAYPSFGVEWRAPMLDGLTGSLRAGYDGRLSSSGLGGTVGACFGGGLGYDRFVFDYGWTAAGGLGNTSRLTLSYRF